VGKWAFVGLFCLEVFGRNLIGAAFKETDRKQTFLAAINGQEPTMSQGALYKIIFSALFWSILPLWAGIKTKQPLKGIGLAVICFAISSIFPLFSITPMILGVGGYFYLKTNKEVSGGINE
jgi:hypothetical protein